MTGGHRKVMNFYTKVLPAESRWITSLRSVKTPSKSPKVKRFSSSQINTEDFFQTSRCYELKKAGSYSAYTMSSTSRPYSRSYSNVRSAPSRSYSRNRSKSSYVTNEQPIKRRFSDLLRTAGSLSSPRYPVPRLPSGQIDMNRFCKPPRCYSVPTYYSRPQKASYEPFRF